MPWAWDLISIWLGLFWWPWPSWSRYSILGHATATILGALLSWAFISAYIGAVEIPGYTGTVAFAVSLLLGAAGLALLAASCLKLRKPPDA